MIAHLRITRSDGRTEDVSLPLGAYVVGRDTGHIVLNDPQVSGNHAQIEVHPRGVVLTDHGSSNGTFDSQGQRLIQSTTMQPDRAFRLGNSSITLTRAIVPPGGTVLASTAMDRSALPQAPTAAVASHRPWESTAHDASPPFVPSVASFGYVPAHPVVSTTPNHGYVAGFVHQSRESSPRVNRGSFLGPAIFGGLIGGVLSCIPLVGMLNVACCLLTVIGCQIGLSLYFRNHPNDMLSDSDAATFGFIAGMTTGIIMLFLGILALGVTLGPLAGFAFNKSVKDEAMLLMFGVVVVHAAFGALGGFLGMRLFFTTRRAVGPR